MRIGFYLALAGSVRGERSEAVNTVAPSISGTGFVGDEHEGDNGTWTGAEAFEVRWRFNGPIVDTDDAYTPDTFGFLVFQVRGQDANGVWSRWYSSDPLTITFEVGGDFNNDFNSDFGVAA